MKKLLSFVLLVLMFLIFTKPVAANEAFYSGSGKLIALKTTGSDTRVEQLRAYLETKNSGCSQYAQDFIYYADKYGLDWKLGPAISGIESSFCQFYPREYNNPFGIAGGFYYFKDLSESIDYLNKLISTGTYYQKFQETGDIYDLAYVYCERGDHWAGAVSKFMAEIEDFTPSEPDTLPINL